MYKGKEVCQGCKTPGAIKHRFSKTDLCRDCKSLLKLGKGELKAKELDYVTFRFVWYYFRDKALDSLVRDFFKSLHNPDVETYEKVTGFEGSGTTHHELYTVPRQSYEGMREFALKMRDYVDDLTKRENAIEPNAEKLIQQKFDEVYNKGIERGRNLLLSLAANDVTISDLTEKAESYQFTNH